MAAFGLVIYRNGPNAVWGTATLALVIGIVAAFVAGWPFWATVGKAVAIGALIGLVFQWLPLLTAKGRSGV